MTKAPTQTGIHEDFLTGSVVDKHSVWERPVGVTIGKDGSTFVTDDDSRNVWHITYEGGENDGQAGGKIRLRPRSRQPRCYVFMVTI